MAKLLASVLLPALQLIRLAVGAWWAWAHLSTCDTACGVLKRILSHQCFHSHWVMGKGRQDGHYLWNCFILLPKIIGNFHNSPNRFLNVQLVCNWLASSERNELPEGMAKCLLALPRTPLPIYCGGNLEMDSGLCLASFLLPELVVQVAHHYPASLHAASWSTPQVALYQIKLLQLNVPGK